MTRASPLPCREACGTVSAQKGACVASPLPWAPFLSMWTDKRFHPAARVSCPGPHPGHGETAGEGREQHSCEPSPQPAARSPTGRRSPPHSGRTRAEAGEGALLRPERPGQGPGEARAGLICSSPVGVTALGGPREAARFEEAPISRLASCTLVGGSCSVGVSGRLWGPRTASELLLGKLCLEPPELQGRGWVCAPYYGLLSSLG